MASLDMLLPKIRPLIRMFQSDNDFEIVSAVKRLGQVLKSNGFSFHELADAVGLERAAVKEIVGYGEEYWQPPKPKHGNNDFVEPKRYRPQPKPSGPPVWEEIGRKARLAWLECALTSDRIFADQKTLAADVRAQLRSQPHVELKPARRAEVNRVFASTWMADVRPIADVLPGDRRLPLIWTGKNKGQVERVFKAAMPFLEHKDAQFARSILTRMAKSRSALATPSVDEVETIDRVLLAGYDLGARP